MENNLALTEEGTLFFTRLIGRLDDLADFARRNDLVDKAIALFNLGQAIGTFVDGANDLQDSDGGLCHVNHARCEAPLVEEALSR